jgi:DNA-binding NarL/FixJ family response regulator
MHTDRQLQLLIAGPFVPETRKLHQLLTQNGSIAVVAESLELARVPELTRLWRPDVVLLHTHTTDLAVEAIRSILAELPSARLLVVASSLGYDDAKAILENGARGILELETAYKQGMRAVRAVAGGEIWGSRALLSRMLEASIKRGRQMLDIPRSAVSLTQREYEIVTMLRKGSSNGEIASILQISEKSVITHLQGIYAKLHLQRESRALSALGS